MTHAAERDELPVTAVGPLLERSAVAGTVRSQGELGPLSAGALPLYGAPDVDRGVGERALLRSGQWRRGTQQV